MLNTGNCRYIYVCVYVCDHERLISQCTDPINTLIVRLLGGEECRQPGKAVCLSRTCKCRRHVGNPARPDRPRGTSGDLSVTMLMSGSRVFVRSDKPTQDVPPLVCSAPLEQSSDPGAGHQLRLFVHEAWRWIFTLPLGALFC